MTATYAFPEPRPTWRAYCQKGAARGDYRIHRDYDGTYRTFRMHADMSSTIIGHFDTLEAAQIYVEGIIE